MGDIDARKGGICAYAMAAERVNASLSWVFVVSLFSKGEGYGCRRAQPAIATGEKLGKGGRGNDGRRMATEV